MKNRSSIGVRMPAGYTCVRRAAKELKCTARSVLRCIHDEKVRAQRIGPRYWAVLHADIEHFSAGRTQ